MEPSRNWGSIPARGQDILVFSKTSNPVLGTNQTFIERVTRTAFPLASNRGVHLILHLYLVLRLRIHGGIPQIHIQGVPGGKVNILGG
jgi:hypothetical protein